MSSQYPQTYKAWHEDPEQFWASAALKRSIGSALGIRFSTAMSAFMGAGSPVANATPATIALTGMLLRGGAVSRR